MGFFVPSALSLPCINSASLCRLSQLSQAAWPTALRLPAGGKPVRSPLGARGRGHASGSPPERGFPANDCNVDLAAVVAVLDHLDLAEHVADSDAAALNPRIADADATPEALSLAGAMERARAVIAARDNDRAKARRHIQAARTIAARTGTDGTTSIPSSDPPASRSTP